MDKDMNDLHIKPRDAVDLSNWMKIIRGNWSDRSSDGVAER